MDVNNMIDNDNTNNINNDKPKERRKGYRGKKKEKTPKWDTSPTSTGRP
jgi:hypothetical protein